MAEWTVVSLITGWTCQCVIGVVLLLLLLLVWSECRIRQIRVVRTYFCGLKIGVVLRLSERLW